MSIPAKDISETTLSLPFLLPVERELQAIEAALRMEVSSAVSTLSEASAHVLLGGGKRIRPALVALSARACNGPYDLSRVVRVAAGVELIHMATLMHDDVVDGAELRRGRAAANALWGDHVAVLAGDFMLAKAFSLIACVADTKIMEVLSSATVAMAEGEARQIESLGDADDLTEGYLSIVRDKTASFMSASCRIGAILASSSPFQENALADYGLHLGMAFQITDDLLDLTGDSALTGKPVGSDIREGKLTLPVIIAMEKASPTNRARISDILRGADVTADDIEFVGAVAEETGAIRETREVAESYVRKALGSLAMFADSDVLRALTALAHHVKTRDR